MPRHRPGIRIVVDYFTLVYSPLRAVASGLRTPAGRGAAEMERRTRIWIGLGRRGPGRRHERRPCRARADGPCPTADPAAARGRSPPRRTGTARSPRRPRAARAAPARAAARSSAPSPSSASAAPTRRLRLRRLGAGRGLCRPGPRRLRRGARAARVALQAAIDALLAAPSPETLDAARQAWVDARPAYLRTEAFQFYAGPVDGAGGRCPAQRLAGRPGLHRRHRRRPRGAARTSAASPG